MLPLINDIRLRIPLLPLLYGSKSNKQYIGLAPAPNYAKRIAPIGDNKRIDNALLKGAKR